MSVVEDHSQPTNTIESRKKRLDEYLSKLQACESEIPQHILDAVRGELDKGYIKAPDMLEIKDIKQILKRLSFTNYYNYAPAIRLALKGLPPFRMSLPVEQRFRVLFEAIQGPFELVKKQRRTTQCVISYDYILHKFAKLLDLEDHAQNFPLAADPDKVRCQDHIWTEICEVLGWPYQPSL